MRDRDKYIPEVAEVELDLLVEGVRKVHGVDLAKQGREALRSAVWVGMESEEVRTVSGLQEKLLHNPGSIERFLAQPRRAAGAAGAGFLARFRGEIVPRLRTYPFIRIWQAGCNSVFESYVLNIIFLEEGVYEKSTIYTTDPDPLCLGRSQDGLFPMSELGEYGQWYRESGGKADFTRYYCTGEESGAFDSGLRRNMVFAQHDFATDGSFNEFHAIFCRKSLKALKPSTRCRAERTLCESLVVFGLLRLPRGENLGMGELMERFESLDQEQNLYRKIS